MVERESRVRVDNFVTTQAQFNSVYAPARDAILKRHGDITVTTEKH